MKSSLFVLLFCLSVFCLSAQQTKRVLFLGNSYTGVNNLPLLVSQAASSAGDSLIQDSYTPGGYTLDQHSLDQNALNKISQGGWEFVVLQEQSQLPSFPFYDGGGASLLTFQIGKHNPCARPMFYMTWGRKNGDQSNCAAWPPVCTYEGMDSMLNNNYMDLAFQNKGEVSPVGRVWKRLRQLHPNIELYQTDESHPSEAGSYAAACSFYASIFRKDPTLITFDFTLNTSDASIIRQVAKEVVFDSLANFDFAAPQPTPLFYYTVGTGTNEIKLINASSETESFLWEFGDGDTSTALNPVHSYLNDGVYQVTLHAYDCDLDSVYDSTFTRTVSFCSFTPFVLPDTIKLCPNNPIAFWSMIYPSYQWLDAIGDPIPGENNRYFYPAFGGEFSVQVTDASGCTEISPPGYAISHLHNLVIYNIDDSYMTDSVCIGDSVPMIIYPNKPAPDFYEYHWQVNGVSIPVTGDTLWITSPGSYSVSVENTECPGYMIFESDTQNVAFVNCNIGINEISQNELMLYPQPVTDKLYINNLSGVATDFVIYDITGRKMIAGIAEASSQSIDVSSLSPGVYLFVTSKTNHTILKTY